MAVQALPWAEYVGCEIEQEGKRQEDSSFCEQKEAKKLYPFAWAKQVIGAVHSGCRSEKQVDEVFLLLFVHKKKNLHAA